MDFGAYYYSTAVNTRQAKLEARHAVRLCRGKKLQYPIWMDVEDAATQGRLSKTALTRVIKAFVKEVKRLGYPCGVYASPLLVDRENRQSLRYRCMGCTIQLPYKLPEAGYVAIFQWRKILWRARHL